MDTPIPYQPRPLTTSEQAGNAGMTHASVISVNALTNATPGAVQTITITNLKAGDIITKVAFRVKSYFKATNDPAYNSTTFSVGDTSSVTKHIAATEINANGTTVKQGFSNTAVHYLAADQLTVTFGGMAAKKLLDLDAGEVELFFGLYRPVVLEQSMGNEPVT